MRRRKRLFWLLPIVLALFLAALSLRPHVYLPAHRHCIKIAGLELHTYADGHSGRFPEHPNGYGDAVLLLNDETLFCFTGPGYDSEAPRQAKATGNHFPEDACGRVYIQGLSLKTPSEAAVLFDKLSTPGGDHCHWPMRLWASRGREVLFRDGGFRFIRDADWPAFAGRQIELLVSEGIPRPEAERLYGQVVP